MRLVLLFCMALLCIASSKEAMKKKKKSLADYSEADLEKLYEEWEENDEDVLEEDEQPSYKHKPKPVDVDELKKKAKSPEDLLRMSKKDQQLMMFVGIVDPSAPGGKAARAFSDKWTGIWHSNLYNNHMDVQVFLVDDDRAIFMFKDGAQAFEAKDFLVKQQYCSEVTLEGQQFAGKGASAKAKADKTEL